MATEILLTNEAFVKSATSISDNINAKYLRSAIREAQEINFKRIVGSYLLARLKEMVADGTIEDAENAAYKELVERAQWYLAYTAIVEVTVRVGYKVANIGVAKTADQNIYNASANEIAKLRYYYQAKADAICYELQRWLLDNSAAFPELSACSCAAIRANLRSAASCGIWLGGARGKGRAASIEDINLGRRIR